MEFALQALSLFSLSLYDLKKKVCFEKCFAKDEAGCESAFCVAVDTVKISLLTLVQLSAV